MNPTSNVLPKTLSGGIEKGEKSPRPKNIIISRLIKNTLRTPSIYVDPYENSNNEDSKAPLSFITNYPYFNRINSFSPSVRKLSLTERENSDLIESEEVVAKKDNLERIERVKKRLLSKPVESLGNSINHVFEICEGQNEKIAYLKFSPDGKIYVPIMEKTVARITSILELSHFVESDITYISPRSGKGLLICEKTKRFSSRSKKASLRRIKKRSAAHEKKTLRSKSNLKMRRNSSSVNEVYKLDRIPSAISKPVSGKTLQYISKLHSMSSSGSILLQQCDRKESSYYPYFAQLKGEDVDNSFLQNEYDFLFIEGVLNSIIIGTSDAHHGNITLYEDGFYHLDQGRSISHSNNFLIWADAVKLPYYSAFINESDFFKEISHENLTWIHDTIRAVKYKLKKVKEFLHHPMQKDEEGIDQLPLGWLDRVSVYEAMWQRVTRIKDWVKKKKKKNASPANLGDLLCCVYPYQALVTCLAVTVRLIPNHLVAARSENETFLIERMWEDGMLEAREVLNHPNSIDGERCDVFTLVDQFIQLGFDPKELSELVEPEVDCKKKIRLFYDTLLNKIDRCADLLELDSSVEGKIPASLALFNRLRKALGKCAGCHVDAQSELQSELVEILNGIIELDRAPKRVLTRDETFASTYKSALWVFEKNAFYYLKTILETDHEIKGKINDHSKIKEFKLSLCKDAKIDYKDLNEYQTNFWLIKYLHKLCTIAETPYFDPDCIPPLKESEFPETSFYTNAFATLKSNFFSKGYFLSFHELPQEEKDPKFLQVGCTLDYTNKNGVLEKSKKRITVIVVEGKINFRVDNHLIPFDKFFRELESDFPAKALDPLNEKNRNFVTQLYLFDYFDSEDFGVEFFNYDEFPQEDIHAIFPMIHEFILFFERSYVFHREGKFTFYYLDKEGEMNFKDLKFDKEKQIFNVDEQKIAVSDLSKWVKKTVPYEQFNSGRSTIKLLDDNNFIVSCEDEISLGTFDPGGLSVNLSKKNKEPLFSDLSLEEFITWTATGKITAENPVIKTHQLPVELVHKEVIEKKSTFEILKATLMYSGIEVFDFDDYPDDTYQQFPKIHDHLLSSKGCYVMHRKKMLSLHYIDHTKSEKLIKLRLSDDELSLKFNDEEMEIDQFCLWVNKEVLF